MPFILSDAHIKFNLKKKNIALACSSHWGEQIHINVLKKWIEKVNLSPNQLLCGIHNPINLKCSNKVFLSGNRPNQLHNNCSGKHLAMISGCKANNLSFKNYIDFKHPYQKLIRESLEYFMGSKIKKECIAIDGCGAPQYAFSLNDICDSMVKLIKEKYSNNENSKAVNLILSSINKYPELIGGNKSFDSQLIKITRGRIFCKGGAEGVLLFADIKNKVGGVVKVRDGNERARPSITIEILSKLKLISKNEKKMLAFWINQEIHNHSKKKIGAIKAQIKI